MSSTIRTNTLVYTILLAAHVMLVWLLPYFPTQDGPCHLYNLVILQDLLHGGKEWGNFYTYTLHLVPNLGFNLLAYPLINFLSPLVVERVFLTLYMVLMGSSVPLLLKTFGRPIFPFAYFVFPVIFNYTLLMGFYSYVIAVPLFIFAFSLAWKIRDRSIIWKFICYNLSGLILFYFHLIPSVFFLISLISISLAEVGSYQKKSHKLLLLFATISPFMLNLVYYFKQGPKQALPDFSYLLSFSRIVDLVTDLLSFSTVNLSPWQLLPGSLLMSLVIVMVYSSLKEIWQAEGDMHEAHASKKVFAILTIIFTLIYLVAPFRLGDGSYFNQRFPWVILLILLPLLRLPQMAIFRHAGTPIITFSVTLFFVFNTAILWQENTKISQFLSGLQVDIPKGAFVMAYKTKPPDWARVDVLLHATSYYGIFKGCVDIGNYEASYDLFPVRFKKNLPPLPSHEEVSYEPASIRLSDYPSIHYLLGWEIDNNDLAKLDNFFHVVWEDGPLTVWQRN